MEQIQQKFWNYATLAAILIGISNAVPNYLDYLFSNPILGYFSLPWKAITSFLILYYAGSKMASEIGSGIDPKLLKWSYLSCILSGIVEGFFMIVYIKVLNPEYIAQIKELMIQIVKSDPAYKAETIHSVLSSIETLTSPTGIIFSCILTAIFAGAIISLIVVPFINKRIIKSKKSE